MISYSQKLKLKKLASTYAKAYANHYYAEDQLFGKRVVDAEQEFLEAEKKLNKYIDSISETRPTRLQDPPF